MKNKKNEQNSIKKIGLIGFPLSHSFSKKYFSQKFEQIGINNIQYKNIEIKDINKFVELIKNNSEYIGFNVTIPYKTEILKYVDYQDDIVKKINATNTLKIVEGNIYAFNTDVYGFEKSFTIHLEAHHKNALILGTGGASKAVAYVLQKLLISYKFVSRKPKNKNEISYKDLDKETLNKNQIIINTTPLGSFPNLEKKPEIPYKFINRNHYFYDLIYNPTETIFLEKARKKGAITSNGLKMLHLQAEKSWEIWNNKIT